MYFYEKPLSEFTAEEWEKICMKCGKCCLCKYSEDNVIHFSNYICKFFDMKKGICSCYKTRFEKANDECQKVNMALLENEIYSLPPDCAYRCLYEGRPLPPYHPLITDDPKSVLRAKKTVLSMPIYSESAQSEAINCLIEQAIEENWNENKIRKGIKQICRKYRRKWLATYPLQKK